MHRYDKNHGESPSEELLEESVGCIVGAVVQLHTDHGGVAQQLGKNFKIEVHAQDEQSRLVITIEAASSKEVMKLSEDIQNMDGVLQITPVYQHSEDNQNDKQDGGWRWR